jgi:hypothetical protein
MKRKVVTKRFHEDDDNRDWVESWWTRPVNGGSYEWFNGAPATAAGAQGESDRRWLVGNFSADQLASYRPLVDCPALFRTFADLEPAEDGFRSFANLFGGLGTQMPACTAEGALFSGESLTRLLAEHEALKQVVVILDALKRGSGLRTCARHISQTDLSNGHIERASTSSDFRDLKEGCVMWVQATINTHLNGAARSRGDVVVTVLGRDASGNLRLQQATRSLVGVLWLQCARAAEGHQEFRQCKVRSCRTWFLISPVGGGRRRQSLYCSDRCKVRACRAGEPKRRRLRELARAVAARRRSK